MGSFMSIQEKNKGAIMTNNKLTEIVELLTEAQEDCVKFDKGNSTAGTRVRKTAQEVIHALKDLRKLVQETKNERKTN
jgi:hypothetical protein